MNTYILKVSLTQEDDGRWSVAVPLLSGCASWGWTKGEALANIKDACEAYIEDMIEAGKSLPFSGIEVIKEPAVAVCV